MEKTIRGNPSERVYIYTHHPAHRLSLEPAPNTCIGKGCPFQTDPLHVPFQATRVHDFEGPLVQVFSSSHPDLKVTYGVIPYIIGGNEFTNQVILLHKIMCNPVSINNKPRNTFEHPWFPQHVVCILPQCISLSHVVIDHVTSTVAHVKSSSISQVLYNYSAKSCYVHLPTNTQHKTKNTSPRTPTKKAETETC